VHFPSPDANRLVTWLREEADRLPTAVFSAVTDVERDNGGVSVSFGPGPEPAIQAVDGRDVACHLHGVTVRDGGNHVGDPSGA
jgi:peptide/nickel transport system ATP-binding protein